MSEMHEMNSAWSAMLGGGWMSNMMRMQSATLQAASRNMAMMTEMYSRLWSAAMGERPKAKDVLPPDQRFDSRFKDEAWDNNPAFDAVKEAYLIWEDWVMGLTDSWKDISPDLHKRAAFYTRQMADAISPSNFPWSNPAVLREIINTGGANLSRGMRNFVADASKGRISQVQEGAFKVGRDLAITPGKVVYRNKLIELIQYAPTTKQVHEVPLLLMPPWINKYYILDLRPDNSMAKWLVDNGQTVFMISWRNPDGTLRDASWDDFMTLGPLAALEAVKSITGADKVNVTGYCLGGIMLQSTLSYLTAIGQEKQINTATFFTTHQDFGDAGDVSVFISEPEVRFLEYLMDISGGYLDGRNMASTFNMLRANDLIWPYVVNNYMLGKQPQALDLLQWNSDGTRVPKKCHLFLLRNFFLEPKFAKPGFRLKGVHTNLHKVNVDTYAVAANTDHIVPWRGAFRIRETTDSPVRFVLAESGHIAGIVNHPIAKKRGFWTNDSATTDPDEWFATSTRTPGSWWEDWLAWISARSGATIAPPATGNAEHPPMYDAPGKYVLET